jgi:GH15 family glucan-1,4-alpha-glucosidase
MLYFSTIFYRGSSCSSLRSLHGQAATLADAYAFSSTRSALGARSVLRYLEPSIINYLSETSAISQGFSTQTKSRVEVGPIPSIQDYAIIGDCRSAALVSCQGSIDWLCWPRFDKTSIFAALLDRQQGGCWQIGPAGEHASSRRYLPQSNVLQTHFSTASGAATLTDFMPVASELPKRTLLFPDQEILRRLECTDGEIAIDVSFAPRANYGKDSVHIRDVGRLGLRIEAGRGVYCLRSSTALKLSAEADTAFARLHLKRGDTLCFSFSYSEEAPAVLSPLEDSIVTARIGHSAHWWQQWAQRADYDGAYRDEVIRSALTLKLLTYAPSGAIIAALTTSLPERIGGNLNWDYRYCWLRDASLTVRALLELGYWEEAEDFVDWMLQATRLTQPELRILYDVYGESAPKERTLDYLSGYKGSRPVRIGNAARNQTQLDVYGEVVDAVAQFAYHGRPLDRETQKVLIGFGDYVVKHWQEPDEGIWEPRTSPRHHTHSRLLCWVALDRLISLHKKGLLPKAPADVYAQHSNRIRREIHHRAWNTRLRSYVSVLDSDELDASLLLLSWYGFERAASPRMRRTYRALLDHLGTSNGLLYRYPSEAEEGTFAICSFWEAEYLALGGGSLAQSHALFKRLLVYHSDLGLYAEEIDPATGAALGNFPQAFTHIGLIGAALSIRQREKGEEQLAHRPDTATRQTSTPEPQHELV